MFGMGFMEILLVAIIAIIALGPDKLPGAMVEIARFFKKFKSGIEDAKSTLDNELSISDMKEEANKFKAQIDSAKASVSMPDMNLGVSDLLKDDLTPNKISEDNKEENVSFKKKKEKPIEETNASDKFKVNTSKDKDEA